MACRRVYGGSAGCAESRIRGCGSACDDAAVEPIALAVIDDHPAITLAITAAIDAEAGADLGVNLAIRMVGAARRLGPALELLRQADKPDVVLCDIQLESGIDGLRSSRRRHGSAFAPLS